MKKANDPRHLARVLALQYLFSKDFKLETPVGGRVDFSMEELAVIDEYTQYDSKLYENIIKGVKDNFDQLDSLIRQHAPQWPIDQIKKIDLAILRMALYEGFLSSSTPPKVAIDEAIELAKDFGGSASDKFVNGVLGAIFEKAQKNGDTK